MEVSRNDDDGILPSCWIRTALQREVPGRTMLLAHY
jgi:hypothetical protein